MVEEVIMDNIYRGNFEFVREIYPDLYTKISEAESLAYIDCVAAGRNLRDVYEIWLSLLVDEYGIILNSDGRASLNDKRSALKSENKLPQLNEYKFTSVTGEKKSLDGYLVWLKFGNQCSHPEKTPDDPDVTCANLEVVLRIVHKIFRLEYIRKKSKEAGNKIGLFDPYIMPIGDNYVIKSYVPLDKPVSNCVREYETCSYNETGRINKYGIVRVFQKKHMDEKLLQLRDKEAFSEAEAEAGIQFDGNVQVDVLSKMGSVNSDHYVVIYKFSKKPVRLSDAIISEMSMEDRQELCLQLSKIMHKFHTLSTPIYHRNLCFDSVYVCRNKYDKYEPSIIKLDCAKIASKEFGTVIANVQNMQTMIQQQKVLKYAAPEVRMSMQNNTVNVDWEKADIFSLGVLFADILNGQIEASIVPPAKLQRAGVKMQLIQLIDKMRNPNAEHRPTAEIINRSLEEMD